MLFGIKSCDGEFGLNITTFRFHTKCIFAERFTDPDRSDVRPQEAYQALLASMQPVGWTLHGLGIRLSVMQDWLGEMG